LDDYYPPRWTEEDRKRWMERKRGKEEAEKWAKLPIPETRKRELWRLREQEAKATEAVRLLKSQRGSPFVRRAD
jgi:hypothetical protein